MIEKERLEEERRLDTIMEIERLKACKYYDERERERERQFKDGSKYVIEQMSERERERLRQVGAGHPSLRLSFPTLAAHLFHLASPQLEEQDQEREAMKRQYEELKAKEEAKLVAKKEFGEQLRRDTAYSNAVQITLKQQAAQAEKDEEMRIAAYVKAAAAPTAAAALTTAAALTALPPH